METKSIEEIEFAVSRLSADDLAKFRAWFDNFDADAFDRRLESDAKSGKLDRLAAKALADHQAGRSPRTMTHLASAGFWLAYDTLPEAVRRVADRNYALLKENPRHPSLHFKKVGRYWSVRAALRYRALAVEVEEGLLWFWMGSHADYDAMIGT